MKQANDKLPLALFAFAMVAGVLVEHTGMAIADEAWRLPTASANTSSQATGKSPDVRRVLADATENEWPIPTYKVIVRPPYKPDKTGSPFVDNDLGISGDGVIYER